MKYEILYKWSQINAWKVKSWTVTNPERKKKTLLRQIQNEPFFSSKFNPLSIWADY